MSSKHLITTVATIRTLLFEALQGLLRDGVHHQRGEVFSTAALVNPEHRVLESVARDLGLLKHQCRVEIIALTNVNPSVDYGKS
jgi:hypothetical protein